MCGGDDHVREIAVPAEKDSSVSSSDSSATIMSAASLTM